VEVAWDGRPALRLHGRAAERAAELGVVRSHLSLTHADHTAAAVVVLEG
jgi:holo-[acyl-carrier protein] synthase